MDTQTLFAIIGSIAGVGAVCIFIVSLLVKVAGLEIEKRVMEKMDSKFDEFEAKIAKHVDGRLDTFENRVLERVTETVVEVLESHSNNVNRK